MRRKPDQSGPHAGRARRAWVEEIEPRILYSADFSPGLVETATPLDDPEQRLLDGSGEFVSASAEDVASQTNAGTSDSGDTASQGSWELELLVEEGTISAQDLGLFHYTDDPQEAWDLIKSFYQL